MIRKEKIERAEVKTETVTLRQTCRGVIPVADRRGDDRNWVRITQKIFRRSGDAGSGMFTKVVSRGGEHGAVIYRLPGRPVSNM
ncbi:MAG: hypothetical protein LAT80_12405 [Balneolaceae bacterium]|nr:hypothetical protein [Balneolaceae bacterium]